MIAKEKAESASRIKSEFLDIAAHELRTPLTALTLMIGTMQQFRKHGIPIDPATLDKSAQQVDRLARLVSDLLNVSVLERGALVLRREKIDLTELISESLDNYRRLAPGRSFVFEKPEKPLMLDADPVRLLQVLGNFLDNALKYTPETTPIMITATTTSNNKVRVSVTDKGKGIDKESLPQLFTRFYRTGSDETLKQPGLGLGLYICRRIIELHGGHIGVSSEVGQGSTFYFEIPTSGA
jgi:signal transduction histidine kinase